jgi:hypothetical protein
MRRVTLDRVNIKPDTKGGLIFEPLDGLTHALSLLLRDGVAPIKHNNVDSGGTGLRTICFAF